ncbi:MAG: homoserine kinase [Erysipelotrichaceae bacterium]|nr:homoserine kinase [Erysipelotrichaceae bacterium]
MIRIRVPATSANLGIGYDCLGAALDWWSSFEFCENDHLQIEGCPEEYRGEDNLVVRSFAHVCEYLGKALPPFRLKIESDIPLKRGLGSSAVCITAGVLAANEWFDCPLSKEECLKLACEIEGHPDNLAPAFYGGVIFSNYDGEKVEYYPLECSPFSAALVIPDYPIETEKARAILPSVISHKAAAGQVFQALKFAEALAQGNDTLLKESLIDALHEPYRKTLIPDHNPVRDCCHERGLPFWISGSGSTLAGISFSEKKIDELICELQKRRPDLTVRKTVLSKEGAKISHE